MRSTIVERQHAALFNVSNETGHCEDPVGQAFPNDDAARRGGERLAVKLSKEEPLFNGSTLVVVDGKGNKIGDFPISLEKTHLL